MKNVIIVLAFSISACATAHNRCESLSENPYGFREDSTKEEYEAKFKEIKEKHFPTLSTEEAIERIRAATKFEWQNYGSMNACIASKEARDRALAYQLDGFIDAAQRAAVPPENNTYAPATAVVEVKKHKSMVELGECVDLCKLSRFESQCRARCYQE